MIENCQSLSFYALITHISRRASTIPSFATAGNGITWLTDRSYLPLPGAADKKPINGWLVECYPLISFHPLPPGVKKPGIKNKIRHSIKAIPEPPLSTPRHDTPLPNETS
jgi:hypothetical protein